METEGEELKEIHPNGQLDPESLLTSFRECLSINLVDGSSRNFRKKPKISLPAEPEETDSLI